MSNNLNTKKSIFWYGMLGDRKNLEICGLTTLKEQKA